MLETIKKYEVTFVREKLLYTVSASGEMSKSWPYNYIRMVKIILISFNLRDLL